MLTGEITSSASHPTQQFIICDYANPLWPAKRKPRFLIFASGKCHAPLAHALGVPNELMAKPRALLVALVAAQH
jgi:hypothetical protein